MGNSLVGVSRISHGFKSLLHRHTFRQISWHVGVVLAEDGQLVGEDLDGDDVGDGGGFAGVWDADPEVEYFVVFWGNADDVAAAGFDFGGVGESLFGGFVVRDEGDDGGAFGDQGKGAVF